MKRLFPLLIVLALLLAVYLGTLQTIPNGSDHYFMIDVGETQIVLNVWGTLHFTGYPHYVISGNLLVGLFRLLGIESATAPAVVSLLWGLLALIVIYMLGTRLTRQSFAAALMMLLFGLTRTVWIHHNIAEIYTFGLLLVVMLYAIALWPVYPLQPAQDNPTLNPSSSTGRDLKNRLQRFLPSPAGGGKAGDGGLTANPIYLLALIGGMAVAHHRAIVTLIPALLFAVWPDLMATRRRLPRLLIVCLLLGLIGLIPYLYLPLRANAGAIWVYGEPGTLPGLWTQFMGAEGLRFAGLPGSWDALLANVQLVNDVLLTDLTAPGLLLGLIGLLLASRSSRHRTAALTFILGGLGAYGFHAVFYSDVLSALILQVTLSIAFGWLFLMDWLLVRFLQRTAQPDMASVGEGLRSSLANTFPDQKNSMKSPLYVWRGDLGVRSWQTHRSAQILVALVAILMALLLWAQNFPFIRTLTTDSTGLETIALAQEVPPDVTLMLPWGTRHFAVGLARDVWGQRTDLTLVDHKADFQTIARCVRASEQTVLNPLIPSPSAPNPGEKGVEFALRSPSLNSGRELEGGVNLQPTSNPDCDSRFDPLVTPDYVFYNYPVDWWQTQINSPVFLRAAGPGLVEIATAPQITNHVLPAPVNVLESVLMCTPDHITLAVDWAAPQPPDTDYSVFVHLMDRDGDLIAQADQSAPVYGWRPLTSWLASEIVHDVYRLPRATDSGTIRFGLYRQLPDGAFQNDYEYERAVDCD